MYVMKEIRTSWTRFFNTMHANIWWFRQKHIKHIFFFLTGLLKLASDGAAEEVGAVITEGADPDAGIPAGQDTPLILAAFSGHADVVVKLIVAKCNVNHRGLDGRTAIWWAAHHQDKHLLQLLLDARAEPKEDDQGFYSACFVTEILIGYLWYSEHWSLQNADKISKIIKKVDK